MAKNDVKEVEFKGKTFRIKKFNPQVGCYWAFQLLGDVAQMRSIDDIGTALKDFVKMNKNQFRELQSDCLNHVTVILDGGAIPLINADGFYSIPEVDAPMAFHLTVQAFLFTLVDFFDKALLTSLSGAVKEIFQVIGGENSSQPQSDSNTGNMTTSGMENTLSQTGST